MTGYQCALSSILPRFSAASMEMTGDQRALSSRLSHFSAVSMWMRLPMHTVISSCAKSRQIMRSFQKSLSPTVSWRPGICFPSVQSNVHGTVKRAQLKSLCCWDISPIIPPYISFSRPLPQTWAPRAPSAAPSCQSLPSAQPPTARRWRSSWNTLVWCWGTPTPCRSPLKHRQRIHIWWCTETETSRWLTCVTGVGVQKQTDGDEQLTELC